MKAALPNIIFMLADDHASKAISSYGAGINHTPNIDRLANEGARFDHCYVTNSICTPSRAAILTGMHSHANGVFTLNNEINNRLPNVGKSMQMGGYQTAMIGKWHLGEGDEHCPTGFDYWSVVPGQGEYWDPQFIENEPTNYVKEEGYAVDIVTDKAINWLNHRNQSQPFFMMYHQKAPHRSWEYHPRYNDLYNDHIQLPDTFQDDYKHRANAASAAEMRVADDLTYFDLGLVQPEGGNEIGELFYPNASTQRKVPNPVNVTGLSLMDKETGEEYTFKNQSQLADFKFQRYMQRYLRVVQSVDDGVGRILDYLDENDLVDNTLVIYSSDQGMFLGDHGWFDKRFIYEESFQMPLLARYPPEIKAGSVIDDIVQNVDFAPTMLDIAGQGVPTYMQGHSFREIMKNNTPESWDQLAYHRYWMHDDPIHHAYAHYGVRDHRYKIIYWYNLGFGLEGADEGGEEKQWELFDTQEDPLEVFNVYSEPGYEQIRDDMKRKLERKMLDIGDVWVHDAHSATEGTRKPSEALLRAKREAVN
ncbi:hypothetical protein KC365_g12461 [Hortaea werneckii]|nr:hypothetical protein KC342_g14277 [Hortaea werneckii]KAI7066568.1 hypothetical protein KC339_g15481 [Hortaea werneckii]KAI7218955.1 hypothetical protein KC365_g12461 [Hortaea werneckii]